MPGAVPESRLMGSLAAGAQRRKLQRVFQQVQVQEVRLHPRPYQCARSSDSARSDVRVGTVRRDSAGMRFVHA